jgi:hypothetical protein
MDGGTLQDFLQPDQQKCMVTVHAKAGATVCFIFPLQFCISNLRKNKDLRKNVMAVTRQRVQTHRYLVIPGLSLPCDLNRASP